MNERLKKLRKTLDLTQQKLADRIGVKRNTVAQWELGINSLTDQVITSICREFNVNENWLRTGNGDMFNSMSDDEELDLYIGRISGGTDEFKKKLIKSLCKLSDDEWDVLKKIVSDMK